MTVLLQGRLFDDGVQPTDEATERRAERRRRRWRVMSRDRKPIHSTLAARLTPRQQEAAELLYARYSPSEIAAELTVNDPSKLLSEVYAEAGIDGEAGSRKQQRFIRQQDALFEADRSQKPAALPVRGIQFPNSATG